MHKIFWAVISVSLIAFIAILIQVGIGPKPVAVIKPSLVAAPENAGLWSYRQLRHQVFKYGVLFLGLDQDASHSEIAKGFIETAQNDGQKIQAVLVPAQFHFEAPVAKVLYQHLSQVPQLALPYILAGQKIVVLLPAPESSHLVKESFLQRFEQATEKNPFVISFLSWKKDDPAHELARPHCDEASKLTRFDDFRMFYCLYFGKAKRFDKLLEKQKEERFGMTLDQFGQSNYLLLTYDLRSTKN